MRFQRLVGVVARGSLRALVAGFVLVAVSAVGSAAPIISGLKATGTEYPVGTGGQDSFWEVYAFPTAYTGPLTAGYQAWVFSGGSPPLNVPRQWFPGPLNGGSDNAGANGARWIGLRNDDASALWPGLLSVPQSDYTVIYRTSFQASSAGVASFSLLTAADNAVSFFVGGTVDNTDPYKPTMTGEQIGSERQGLGSIGWVNGSATVTSGSNYLYAVVRDIFIIDGSNPAVGTYGQSGFIVVAVPEPSTMVLAALGGVVIASGVVRRRLRRA